MDGQRAALEIGISESTAKKWASLTLDDPDVQTHIKRLQDERSKRTAIAADRVIIELARLAFSDLADAFDNNGDLKQPNEMPEALRRAIAAMEMIDRFVGRGDDRMRVRSVKRIRLWDKVSALELLGKHLGLFVDKVEHSGPSSGPFQRPLTELELAVHVASILDTAQKRMEADQKRPAK
jgi:phage terminase small subunit